MTGVVQGQAEEGCRPSGSQEDQADEHYDEEVRMNPSQAETFLDSANSARSFFGTQEGKFSLKIKNITVIEKAPKSSESKLPLVYDPHRLEAGTVSSANTAERYYSLSVNSRLVSVRMITKYSDRETRQSVTDHSTQGRVLIHKKGAAIMALAFVALLLLAVFQ